MEYSKLTDEELLKKAQTLKSKPIINAILVGFLIGIILYSIFKNTIGFLTLIPLVLIFHFVNTSKRAKELESVLKQRNLK